MLIFDIPLPGCDRVHVAVTLFSVLHLPPEIGNYLRSILSQFKRFILVWRDRVLLKRLKREKRLQLLSAYMPKSLACLTLSYE